MYKCKKIRQEKHPLRDNPQYFNISAMVYFIISLTNLVLLSHQVRLIFRPNNPPEITNSVRITRSCKRKAVRYS